jgi:hypothetical protein
MAESEERQIIARDIDRNGSEHEKQADPDTPILMRPFPIRALAAMNAFAPLPFVPGVTVVTLIHCFSPFSIPSLAGT